MIQRSKVGDAVSIRPLRGRVLHGAVVAIATVGPEVRAVATDDGLYYVLPAEMWPSDEPARLRRAADVSEGDVLVMFTGEHRTVATIATATRPEPVVRWTFAEDDGRWPSIATNPDALWRYVDDA